MSKTISILGCGWLGFPLAKALLQKGFRIKGNYRNPARKEELEMSGIVPYGVQLDLGGVLGDVDLFLQDTDVLVIAVPPGLRAGGSESYVTKMAHLVPFLEKHQIPKVLFVSSTSVFGNMQGEVTEMSVPEPETLAGIQILEVEKLLQINLSFETTILRLAGLIGADRNPVKQLSAKGICKGASSPVNLIWQQDAIALLIQIIEKELWNKVIHGVHSEHPTKSDFYSKQAELLGIEKPVFVDEENSNKIVKSLFS